MQRVILHCDMNNFYASVECMLNPELKNKPVAVCGSVEERHGIVLAKIYAAKAFGVSTGEAIWQAKQKCQDLVIVEPHYFQKSFFGSEADDPARFALPTPIDQFASDYLNLKVSFQKLSSDGSIYGLTAYVDTEYQIQRFKTVCGMSGDLSCSLTWSLTKFF